MGSRLSRQAKSLSAASHYAVATGPRPIGGFARGNSPSLFAPRWSRIDFICMALGFVLTLSLAAAMGHQRIFWEDELLGWMLLRDPSWKHMLAGWLKGVDGGGILFYLTGRLWFKVFGASVLSFRMYSATGFARRTCGTLGLRSTLLPPDSSSFRNSYHLVHQPRAGAGVVRRALLWAGHGV